MSTASRLSDELLAGAALMERRSESIRAVMNSEQNRLFRQLVDEAADERQQESERGRR